MAEYGDKGSRGVGRACSASAYYSLDWRDDMVSVAGSQECRANARGCSLINHLSTKDDFEHYFSISQPSLLFVDSSLLQIVRSVVDTSHPHLTKRIITLAGAKDGYIDVRFPSSCRSPYH